MRCIPFYALAALVATNAACTYVHEKSIEPIINRMRANGVYARNIKHAVTDYRGTAYCGEYFLDLMLAMQERNEDFPHAYWATQTISIARQPALEAIMSADDYPGAPAARIAAFIAVRQLVSRCYTK